MLGPVQERESELDEPNRIVFTEPDTKITTAMTFVNSGSGTVLTIQQAPV